MFANSGHAFAISPVMTAFLLGFFVCWIVVGPS
jgi:hypothetical protein